MRSEILTAARLAVSRATRIRWPNPSNGAPVRGTSLWASGGVRDAKFFTRNDLQPCAGDNRTKPRV